MFTRTRHAVRVSADDDELAELRRRLYAPGATDADRAAFAAADAARATSEPVAAPVAVVDDPPPPPAPPARPVPARGRIIAVGAATVLVVASAVFVAVAHPFRPGPVTASPVPSVAPSLIGSIPVPAAARAEFLRDLRRGEDPKLLDYLDTHPTTLLASLRASGSTDTTGFSGTGPSTENLAPERPTTRGHMTLVLVTEQDVHFQWTPTTVAPSNDRSGPERPVADLDGAAGAGQPVSGTVAYSGGVPSRLTLLVPAGVHWGAVVVYTD
jgi:hypothetical protein